MWLGPTESSSFSSSSRTLPCAVLHLQRSAVMLMHEALVSPRSGPHTLLSWLKIRELI